MRPVEQELPHGFVGRAPRIVQLRGQIEKLGPRRTPVLIQGESGTGKEVVARALYNAYPRGPFVPIDCGSLVGTMMESELFGHVRGAFTGASENKRGLIEAANGGTAFFDEIGELPLELQVKLLRVLQEKELRPLGSLQRIRVDFRIVAATNRELQKEVAAGRFREDLYYRLNVIRLTIPPLRERKEDIPLLVERFLSQVEGRFTLSYHATEALMEYDWPGNIRELMNCLERMMAFNSGPLLHFEDLPTGVANFMRAGAPGFVTAVAGGGSRGPVAAAVPSAGGPAVVPLQQLEKQAIQHALTHTKGDRTLASQLLGIGRTTLYRKLKEYGLETVDGTLVSCIDGTRGI
jgi:DNA-binding NtrC family response regulator